MPGLAIVADATPASVAMTGGTNEPKPRSGRPAV